MSKSEAFAIATQQSHALGKSPKSYGTVKGRQEARAKFDTPKDDKKTANPGNLESPKMASVYSAFFDELEKISQARAFSSFLKMAMGWDVETGGHSQSTLDNLARRQGHANYAALQAHQTAGAQHALQQTHAIEQTHPVLKSVAGKSDRVLEAEWAQRHAAEKARAAAAATDAMPATGAHSPMAMRPAAPPAPKAPLKLDLHGLGPPRPLPGAAAQVLQKAPLKGAIKPGVVTGMFSNLAKQVHVLR